MRFEFGASRPSARAGPGFYPSVKQVIEVGFIRPIVDEIRNGPFFNINLQVNLMHLFLLRLPGVILHCVIDSLRELNPETRKHMTPLTILTLGLLTYRLHLSTTCPCSHDKLAKNAAVMAITCQRRIELQAGDPDEKPELLVYGYSITLKVRGDILIEMQQGDPDGPVENLEQIGNATFRLETTPAHKPHAEKICQALKEAKKKSTRIDVLDTSILAKKLNLS